MSDFFQIVTALFKNTWDMLVQTIFPGTTLSIAAILIGSVAAVVSLGFIGKLIGVSFTANDVRAIGNLKGGNNQKIKISKNRSSDHISN